MFIMVALIKAWSVKYIQSCLNSDWNGHLPHKQRNNNRAEQRSERSLCLGESNLPPLPSLGVLLARSSGASTLDPILHVAALCSSAVAGLLPLCQASPLKKKRRHAWFHTWKIYVIGQQGQCNTFTILNRTCWKQFMYSSFYRNVFSCRNTWSESR